jgi:hypothetical protein
MDHARQAAGIIGDRGDVQEAADVRTAVTDEDADARFFLADVTLGRKTAGARR